MNERIEKLAVQAGLDLQLQSLRVEKFAELIVSECLSIVDQNTYGPGGEYDYGYGDEKAAADDRASAIYDDIKQHFGVK